MNSDKAYKILIVEDDMIIAADISVQLSNLGYEITGIQTKAENAIKDITNSKPDLIMMDINLAGKMDGVEAAQHILETSKTPVVFLTSNSDDATFQRAIKTKPYAFISKPFQIDDLERSLKIAFQHISSEKQEETENEDQITTLEKV